MVNHNLSPPLRFCLELFRKHRRVANPRALLIVVEFGGFKYFHPDPSKNHPKFDARIFFSHGKKSEKNMKKPLFSQPEIAGSLFFSGNSQWFNHQPVLRPRPRPYLFYRS